MTNREIAEKLVDDFYELEDHSVKSYDELEDKIVQALDAKSARIKVLEDALRFYADPFSWRSRSGKVGITPLTDGSDSEVIDGQYANGKRAREALKEGDA